MSIVLWTDIMYYFRNATHFMKWQNDLHKEFTSFCDMSECFTERMPIILWNDRKLADYFLKSKNATSFSNHLVTHYCNQKSRNVRLHTDRHASRMPPICFYRRLHLSYVWPCLTIWPFMFDHFLKCILINWWSFRTL